MANREPNGYEARDKASISREIIMSRNESGAYKAREKSAVMSIN